MENATGKIIRTIGQIIIGLGVLATIIVWIAVADEFNGATGFGAAIGTFAGTFVSGMMFIGFSEIIFLLQENLNVSRDKDKQNAIKETKREIIIDKKLFEIEKTNKTHDGDTIYVLKLYCENKTYDYKFTEGFRKRNNILEFVENCKQKNYDGAEEYLDRLSTDEKFISFVNKD